MIERTVTVGSSIEHLQRECERCENHEGIGSLVADSIENVIAYVEQLEAERDKLLASLKTFVDPWNQGGDWQSAYTYDTYNNARILIAAVESSAV